MKVSFVLYLQTLFLCSLARFDLATWRVHQPVQPHTFYARLLAFDKTLEQAHFAFVNCSDALMSVSYFHVSTRISAVMNCCVVALSIFYYNIPA